MLTSRRERYFEEFKESVDKVLWDQHKEEMKWLVEVVISSAGSSRNAPPNRRTQYPETPWLFFGHSALSIGRLPSQCPGSADNAPRAGASGAGKSPRACGHPITFSFWMLIWCKIVVMGAILPLNAIVGGS